MAQILFENFLAAERKANMKDFGMFPLDRDLSWVASLPRCVCDEVGLVAGSAISLDLSNGTNWQVTLTANVASFEITLNGSTTGFVQGQTSIITLVQNATGGWTYPLPSTVRQPVPYTPVTQANDATTWYLIWNDGGWDFLTPPDVYLF
jgi:hypothetical protein